MLKVEDGFQKGRAEFRTEVAHLQRLLQGMSYKLESDGYYGPSTEAIISLFQQTENLFVTGCVNNETWMAIENRILSIASEKKKVDRSNSRTETTSTPEEENTEIQFVRFRGDLHWLHKQEGHAGKAYWPGGSSGVTLDPGFDLGYQDLEVTTAHYKKHLTLEQFDAVTRVTGLKGKKSKTALNSSSELLSIRISRPVADSIFPVIALPYWQAISKRISGLSNKSTLSSIQTVLLSLAFNRGYNNAALEVLIQPIEQSNWLQCADLVANMQQNHRLKGIRIRRRREADLIYNQIT